MSTSFRYPTIESCGSGLHDIAAAQRDQALARSSVADYIDAAVTPCISGRLIDPEALSHIRQIAALLPGALTDFFGFECRLSDLEPKADFLVCSRASQGGRELLNGEKPRHGLPSFFQDQPIWRQISAFASEWGNPQSSLFDRVHNLWVEFDVDGVPPSIPVPSVFIGSEGLQRLGPMATPNEMPNHCEWLTGSALPRLLGRDLDPELQAQIARCLNHLPPEARVFQVGLMLARSSSVTRLCIRGVSASSILEYLQSLDPDLGTRELQELVRSLEPMVERIDLDLDVASRVLPKIGLECYFPMERSGVGRFLDHLVSAGAANPVKAEALESWAGMAHERLTPELWPRDLLALSSFLGGRVHSVFARWLHHIKVVYQPGAPLTAKAYLAVHHLWLAPEQLKDLLKLANERATEQL